MALRQTELLAHFVEDKRLGTEREWEEKDLIQRGLDTIRAAQKSQIQCVKFLRSESDTQTSMPTLLTRCWHTDSVQLLFTLLSSQIFVLSMLLLLTFSSIASNIWILYSIMFTFLNVGSNIWFPIVNYVYNAHCRRCVVHSI